jgi:hypothetical protein
MMLISMVKPSKGTADHDERNANTPYCKDSHDRDWQCIDTCPTVGFSICHKGGQRTKSNPPTSKNVANRMPAGTRTKRGNAPNVPRLATQSRAVPAVITIQLWNRESISCWRRDD